MEGSKLKTVFVLYLASAIALNALIIWQVRDSILQGYSDFAALYTAGKLVQQGRASAMYDRRAQWQVQQEFASTVKIRRGPLPYVRPPFESLLFLGLAYLKYPLSCSIKSPYDVNSSAAKACHGRPPHALCSNVVEPFFNHVMNGQHSCAARKPRQARIIRGMEDVKVIFSALQCQPNLLVCKVRQ